MQAWQCPTRTRPRAKDHSGTDCCPSPPTNPTRLSRCGRARGCRERTPTGRRSRRQTPTPTIRRARRGRPERTGPGLIPTAGKNTICGWRTPAGAPRTRDDACPERSRLAPLASGCWRRRGGCGASCDHAQRTQRLPTRTSLQHQGHQGHKGRVPASVRPNREGTPGRPSVSFVSFVLSNGQNLTSRVIFTAKVRFSSTGNPLGNVLRPSL